MTKLANSTTKSRRDKHTNTIGAGGGTVLLLFAERLPDTYWFKAYIILAAPSISVSLSKIIHIIIRQCNIISDMLRDLQCEKSTLRSLRSLKKNAAIPQESIEKLEQVYIAACIKRVEKSSSN